MTERQAVHVRRVGDFVQLSAAAGATAREVATAMMQRVPPDARLDGRLRTRFTADADGCKDEEPDRPDTP